LILIIVLILFGAGKLPKVMGDVAKGVKNFKSGMKEEEEGEEETPKAVPHSETVKSEAPEEKPAQAPVKEKEPVQG